MDATKTAGGRLTGLVLVLALTACAGAADPSTTAAPDQQTTSSPATSPSTSPPASPAPAEFPIPIMDGGTTESAYPTEVTVLYPESAFDQLIDFYEDYSDANGGTAYDMFVGREWLVQGATISVTPVDQAIFPDRPPGAVLFIRLP